MNTLNLTQKEKQFINSYIETIYFTDTGDMDQPESDAEMCEYFKRECIIDCLAFLQRIECYISDDQLDRAAYDFWFTRQGHGVGFWESGRGWSDYQQTEFTKIAESFGHVDALFEEVIL